ncbi:hypothetical protein N431DRAFT_461519 [Stipitochalara longipes BDJ]|nr:hypothetical protein N431DRAFT_461519 [Stipitochalara longipes BDJ]
MAWLDGPDNTIHNFLDMAFSGFSEKAKKRFKSNQAHEKRIREENRLRRQKSRDGISTYRPSSSSISVPDFVPVKQPLPGLISRGPKSADGNRLEVAWPPASVQSALSKVENQALLSPHNSQFDHRTGTRPRQTRSPSEPEVSSNHNSERSAFPASVVSHGTARIPTAEAPLMDPQRTLMEGLRLPTGLQSMFPRSTRHSRREYKDEDYYDEQRQQFSRR